MAETKTKGIKAPTDTAFRVKLVYKNGSCYQRKKIIGAMLKQEAYKRYRKYNVVKYVLDMAYNAKLQKYSGKTLPRYYNVTCKFINTEQPIVYISEWIEQKQK